MDQCFEEFRDRVEKASEKGRALKFPRYGENLRHNSEGIYSYGAKIANLDLNTRTIQKRGYWSKTTSRHYNYAGKVLEENYDFYQREPVEYLAPLVHVENVSYDDHT